MNKTCESCHSYKSGKVFLYDGVCYLVPSKPKFVKKTSNCKHWKEGEKK